MYRRIIVLFNKSSTNSVVRCLLTIKHIDTSKSIICFVIENFDTKIENICLTDTCFS